MPISLEKYAETLYPPVNDSWRGKDYGYGQRPDGSHKGPGFLGELKRPDGGISTELSVGVNIDGKERDIPLIVPTLSKKQLDALLSVPDGVAPWDAIKDYNAIEQKAIEHAQQRIQEGKSPFYGADDEK